MSETETMPETLPLPGLELAAAPRVKAPGSAEPPTPRERFRDHVRRALPGAVILSWEAWEAIMLAADEYQASGIERWARKPGGLGRQR